MLPRQQQAALSISATMLEQVHVIDRATGEPVQIIRAGVPVSGQIVITERGLYATSGESGTLIALR